MKFDKDKMTLIVNRETVDPLNPIIDDDDDDPEGWQSLGGETMRLEFEGGVIIEFEAYNIRRVTKEDDENA